jgi:hypothetical protein
MCTNAKYRRESGTVYTNSGREKLKLSSVPSGKSISCALHDQVGLDLHSNFRRLISEQLDRQIDIHRRAFRLERRKAYDSNGPCRMNLAFQQEYPPEPVDRQTVCTAEQIFSQPRLTPNRHTKGVSKHGAVQLCTCEYDMVDLTRCSAHSVAELSEPGYS